MILTNAIEKLMTSIVFNLNDILFS